MVAGLRIKVFLSTAWRDPQLTVPHPDKTQLGKGPAFPFWAIEWFARASMKILLHGLVDSSHAQTSYLLRPLHDLCRSPKMKHCLGSDQGGHSSQSCPSRSLPHGHWSPPGKQWNCQLAPPPGHHQRTPRRLCILNCHLLYKHKQQSELFVPQLTAEGRQPSHPLGRTPTPRRPAGRLWVRC